MADAGARTVTGGRPASARVLRLAGSLVLVAGAAAWTVTFILFAAQHPGLDSPLLWGPLISCGVLGAGMLLIVAGRPAILEPVMARAGAILVSAGVLVIPMLALPSVIGGVAVIGFVAFILGTPVLGLGLAVQGESRREGVILLIASFAFLGTRLWILGPVQEGLALRAQEVVEVAIALLSGIGWLTVARLAARSR